MRFGTAFRAVGGSPYYSSTAKKEEKEWMSAQRGT